jgi:hypothetical protein
MPPVGFEPTISAGERPQTYALDRAVTGTGIYIYIYISFVNINGIAKIFAVALRPNAGHGFLILEVF